jgi:hypothetical protein
MVELNIQDWWLVCSLVDIARQLAGDSAKGFLVGIQDLVPSLDHI